MDVLLMGQLLLLFLIVIALLVNGLLLRLGWRFRQALSEVPLVLNALLLWAPLFLLVLVIGGAVLAEFNLFTFRDGQDDMSGLSWFIVGMCVVIFANVCSAFTFINLRETLKIASPANSVEGVLPAPGTLGRSESEDQAVE